MQPHSTRVPSLSRHKASGQGVVRLNGVDVYLGVWPAGMRKPPSAVQARYDQHIAEWLVGGRTLSAPSSPITVTELFERFWLHVEAHYVDQDSKPTGEQDEYKMALRPARHLYGSLPAAEFGPLKLKSVRQLMIDGYTHPRYGPQRALSRKVTNQRIGRVVRCFKWGVAEELISGEVLLSLKAVKGLEKGRSGARETEPVKPVPLAVVDETIPHLNRRLAAMVRLLMLTGMRPAELCIMRGCDLDTTGSVWLYRPARHKTQRKGKERIIAIGPKAQQILRPWLRLELQSYLFSPAEAEAERRATLTAARKTPASCGNRPGTNRVKSRKREPGDHYTTSGIHHAITVACKRANARAIEEAHEAGQQIKEGVELVPAWFPYQLRHVAGTEIRRLYGLEAAQVSLGHSSADVTQVYAERNLALAIRVAAEIG